MHTNNKIKYFCYTFLGKIKNIDFVSVTLNLVKFTYLQ